MPYYVYRHEGGLQVEARGPFETEEEAKEKCSKMNQEISIACGGFQVHERDD